MSAGDEGHEDVRAGASGSANRPDAERAFVRVVTAGMALADALRRVALATVALVAAEAAVLRAGAVLLFLGSVALVAFTVSLWICVVALLGWALVLGTGSIGMALGILIALHLGLMIALWYALKYAWRQAMFPAARAELRVLGRELRGHVARFQHAGPRAGEVDP